MMEIKEDECIPFPHEAHQVLTQELLHVFSSQVLVAAGIGSGLSVLGGLLAGSRVVALCSSKAHMSPRMSPIGAVRKRSFPERCCQSPGTLFRMRPRRDEVASISQRLLRQLRLLPQKIQVQLLLLRPAQLHRVCLRHPQVHLPTELQERICCLHLAMLPCDSEKF